MKKILTILFLSFAVSSGYGQKDPKAKEILDQVSKKIRSFSTIKTKFTNTMESQQDKVNEALKGTLYLKGKKYKLEIMGTETYCDGITKWVFLPEPNEVNITDISRLSDEEKESNLLSDPTRLFTLYEKGFKYQYIEEISDKGRNLVLIELVPEDKNKNYFKIKLFIDKATMIPYSLNYFGKDGTRYNIEISELTPNTSMEDAMFSFNPAQHKGVEVIDLREE